MFSIIWCIAWLIIAFLLTGYFLNQLWENNKMGLPIGKLLFYVCLNSVSFIIWEGLLIYYITKYLNK